jgi:hypothetical protein
MTKPQETTERLANVLNYQQSDALCLKSL